jgi:hypothetical protein
LENVTVTAGRTEPAAGGLTAPVAPGAEFGATAASLMASATAFERCFMADGGGNCGGAMAGGGAEPVGCLNDDQFGLWRSTNEVTSARRGARYGGGAVASSASSFADG